MQTKSVKLKFLGGAGTVTGSKTLVEFNGKNVLIDCGLFQGLKELRLLNRADFPINPSEIDYLILTHAHLDHCGYIPVLVKNGFKGEVHCTYPTEKLTTIILNDSAKIQVEDAERANKNCYTSHEKAKPLYTPEDVKNVIPLFVKHNFEEWVILDKDIKFQFHNSGHILGSAFVELNVNHKIFIFSGDIGRSKPMLLYPPKKINQADYIIMESTYGDRLHANIDVKNELKKIIDETFERKGILMIPSFAIERAQEIIYLLSQLIAEEKLPKIPVYLDSPMGVNATNVYDEYPQWQNLPKVEFEKMYDFVNFINDYETSKAIVHDKKPKIVIAGSGMLEGGRILHYLNNHIENPINTILFCGYQAAGTRGRALLDGAEEIKFFGDYKKVKCQVKSISSMSAHGDQKEMLDWLSNFKTKPKQVFLNHGEPHQLDSFRVKIKSTLKWNVVVPNMLESFELD